MAAKLFVGGLSYSVTEPALRAAFSAHGQVTASAIALCKPITARDRLCMLAWAGREVLLALAAVLDALPVACLQMPAP